MADFIGLAAVIINEELQLTCSPFKPNSK